MDAAERAHIEQLLQVNLSVLRDLELKAASFGDLYVPTHITLQIEQQRAKIAELEQRLRAELPYHNLPQPDYEQFVGRAKELAELRRLLQPYPKSRAYVITIDGIGGIGKSALALETAYTFRDTYASLPDAERFETIVWVSAKRSYLTADGILERSQTFRTLDDLYAAIAQVLDYPAITRAKAEDQHAVVEEVLGEHRTLLILDNLETVDDEELLSFLHELPDPTKAIVTTRHRIDVARPIRLTGMSHEDARALITQEATRKGVSLAAEDQEELWQRTGGVPLAIVWSIGLMGLGGSVESVLRRLGSGQSDIARFCFEESLRQIQGRDAHTLLLALSLFVSNAGREALGAVAGLGEDEFGRDVGLEQLLRLSLVNKEGERFSLLPLTRSFVMSEAGQHSEWLQNARERWQEFFYQLALGIDVVSLEWNVLDQVEYDLTNLLAVIDSMVAAISYKNLGEGDRAIEQLSIPIAHKLVDVCDAVGRVCYNRGYWKECERLAAIGIEVGRAINNPVLMGWRFYNLCRIYRQRNELSEARRCVLGAREAWESAGKTELICHADRILGTIAMAENDVQQATQLLTRAMNGYERQNDSDAQEHALAIKGDLAELWGDYAEANVWYTRTLGLLDQNNRRGFRSSILNRLGRVAQRTGDRDAALAYYTESLEIARERSLVPLIASNLLGIAKLSAISDQRAAALAAAQQALIIFRRLGMKREQAEAEALLAQIAQSGDAATQ